MKFFRATAFVVLLASFLSANAKAEEGKTSIAVVQSDRAIFAQAFASAIESQDMQAISNLFDIDALATTMSKAMFDDTIQQTAFKRGFLSNGRMTLVRRMFGNFADIDRAKFLRVLPDERPLVRLDYSGGGHEYILLDVQETDGKLLAVDMFTMTSGREVSKTMNMLGQLMIKPTASRFKRLFGIDIEIDKTTVDVIKSIGDQRRAGEFRGAYDALKSLPQEIQDSRAMVDVAVQLSTSIGEPAYTIELERLARLFGEDKSTSFMLIDHYFGTGQFDEANAATDRLVAFIGNDGAIENLRAGLAYGAGDLEQMELHANRAIRLEPNFEDSYWTLATVYLDQRRFDELATHLQRIETEFGYDFAPEDFEIPEYSEFYDSDAMRNWFDD